MIEFMMGMLVGVCFPLIMLCLHVIKLERVTKKVIE